MVTTTARAEELRYFMQNIYNYADDERNFYDLFRLVEEQFFKDCMNHNLPVLCPYYQTLQIIINDYAQPCFKFIASNKSKPFTPLYNRLIAALLKATQDELNRLEN